MPSSTEKLLKVTFQSCHQQTKYFQREEYVDYLALLEDIHIHFRINIEEWPVLYYYDSQGVDHEIVYRSSFYHFLNCHDKFELHLRLQRKEICELTTMPHLKCYVCESTFVSGYFYKCEKCRPDFYLCRQCLHTHSGHKMICSTGDCLSETLNDADED